MKGVCAPGGGRFARRGDRARDKAWRRLRKFAEHKAAINRAANKFARAFGDRFAGDEMSVRPAEQALFRGVQYGVDMGVHGGKIVAGIGVRDPRE